MSSDTREFIAVMSAVLVVVAVFCVAGLMIAGTINLAEYLF